MAGQHVRALPASAADYPHPRGGARRGDALSPFIKPGTASSVDYNHYSLLKTVEKIFRLPLLGDARQPQVKAFGPDVFTR
jgi:hypothetical protein